ncbi:MAG: tetratricopeptide repeat protein [Gammaproteobacteria bacterium]
MIFTNRYVALFRPCLAALVVASLVACQSLMGPPVSTSPGPAVPGAPPQPTPGRPGTSEPQPQTPTPSQPTPPQPSRQFHLSSASTALVKQSRAQTGKGDFGGATATVERALRIEPDNPLLWIELGQVHLSEGNAPQAESMGRKAVALSTGDPSAQSASWRLVGDALRARGRILDATEAYQRANVATPR